VILLRGGRVLGDLGRDELRAEAGAGTLSKALYRRLTDA